MSLDQINPGQAVYAQDEVRSPRRGEEDSSD